MAEKDQLSRRNFLALATTAIGGLIGLAMTVPALAYIIGPALQRGKTEDWVRLGPTSKVELGTPTLFKTTVERQIGWIKNQDEISVYILTGNGRDYIALSNICTHLGCRVRWIADQQQFFCPCHNGVFDQEGNVLSGPPPRPLDRFTVKVENSEMFVQLGG
jgi:Rieske Fe-S protein